MNVINRKLNSSYNTDYLRYFCIRSTDIKDGNRIFLLRVPAFCDKECFIRLFYIIHFFALFIRKMSSLIYKCSVKIYTF